MKTFNLWDQAPDAQVKAAAEAARKRAEAEAQAQRDWDEAWNKANAHQREVVKQRMDAHAASMRPAPTADENLAAIRRLLEAQQSQGETSA